MKKVGIVGWKTGENSFGATVPYLNFINELYYIFGEQTYATIIAPNAPILEDLDLLILPGGMDTAPRNYGQDPGYFTGNQDVMKEHFFQTRLQHYIDNGTPIFGICLGFQQLCVHFGENLIQDRTTTYSKDRWEQVEQLTITPEAVHWGIKGEKNHPFKVNSLHHQIVPKIENEELHVIAFSTHFGHVEAVRHNTLPIAGVQYHPEELMYERIASQLISSIIKK